MGTGIGAVHAYLAGEGRDGRGRTAEEVLALPDLDLERIHDWVQWLFPLPTRSAAVPGSPVLDPAEIAAIRADPRARATLERAAARMIAFYAATPFWLAPYDHNHLRITRILQSLRLLVGTPAARAFHDALLRRHAAAGAPVNPESLRYWRRALDEG
ncbi:MAG TPA: opioid growth factor receptor-related protein [Microvirga sp.]|jgi:hypothetical protein|nr:opioid growth factor receptor-related protein [Microvirga sp.]